MKHRFTRIALACLALIVTFTAGALTAIKRGWGSPLVSVSIENKTTSPVSLVTLNYSSCGTTNALTAKSLSSGAEHTFKFMVCGEGGYKVDAVLSDGRVLSSGAYVERGYATTEQIEPTRIRSAHRTY